jgi:tripartite-type tricarboxylate transporter receptor subunit TctC
MHSTTAVLFAAILSLVAAVPAGAQTYPSRPVRFICPSAPGSGLDVVARSIMPALTEALGHTVVVDKRPGASGVIALDITSRAVPDGHTMMIFSASQIIYAILNKTNHDMFRDFAPVSQVAAAPYGLVVHPGLPVSNMREFTAYARANPERLTYATSGLGTLQHLATEHLGALIGAKFVHVPYKGVGAAFPDLLAGRTHMTLSSLSALAPHIRSKALRPLAVTSSRRSAMLRDVPTMIEAGVSDFVVTQWHGVIMPAATSQAIVGRMQGEIAKALARPEVRSRLESDGTEAVGSRPDEFAAHMRAEDAQWRTVVKQLGMRMEQ